MTSNVLHCVSRDVEIPSGVHDLQGTLVLPGDAHGIVLFAHGSGSGRHSPRNQFVAKILQEAGFATLLMDLLSEEEADYHDRVFDIEMLGQRLGSAMDWLRSERETRELRAGLFGASTGAAAALVAAARRPEEVGAVVSRGGRPDLARKVLAHVEAPTLLIVGGYDGLVIDLNEDALANLRCEKRLEIVPRATHLFSEPGTLEAVAKLASDWFAAHLALHAVAH